ncbi:MAG: flavodoxin family protein [Candidatus Adiutrix sp.]|jgi:multimeric flavodoxin WrbA|nr:flavodoxin family protein [Candidatus Adiutrix sp.]
MKKVVAILGSPRKESYSSQLAEAAAKAVSGAEVRSFVLNNLNFKGCQGCMSCKSKTEICAVQDDLTQVLAAVAEADSVILSSPIYIGEVTAQLKAFIDRTFSYLLPDFGVNPKPSRLAPGKQLLFIITQGQPDPALYEQSVLGHYLGSFKNLGFNVHKFIAVASQAGEAAVKSVEGIAAKF